MDTKRKEQLQRTLVFTGLGLLFTLSIWFIFRPSANERSAAEQELNKDVPQASWRLWKSRSTSSAQAPCAVACKRLVR